MFWVIQNNLYNEQNYINLIQSLKHLGIPYVEVKVVPFCNRLLPSDFDSFDYHGPIDELSELEIDDTEQIMVCGGINLAKIAQSRNWRPGSFLNGNFHYNKWIENYGEYVLNYDSVVDTFENISPTWDEFFIRPCEDTKDFDGRTFKYEEFREWKDDWLKNKDSCPFTSSQVMASTIKNIYSEYRFFIVDGKIVTYSQYKMGGRIVTSPMVDDYIIDFTRKMVDIWQSARAFVIDVALTDRGLRIIEINNINSAGFYDCDTLKIINAIEEMRI